MNQTVMPPPANRTPSGNPETATEAATLVESIRPGRTAPVAAVHAALSANPWFAALPHATRQAFIAIGEQFDCQGGETLWQAGADSTGMVGVLCGALEDFEFAEGGKRATTLVYAPGDWIGVPASVLGLPRRTSIRAIEPARLLLLPQAKLDALLRERPLIYRDFFDLYNRVVVRDVVPLLVDRALSGEQRLMRALLRFCDADRSGAATKRIPVSQAVLSSMAGLTRARAAQLLARLRAEGIVRTHYSHLDVLEVERLRAHTSAAPKRRRSTNGEAKS